MKAASRPQSTGKLLLEVRDLAAAGDTDGLLRLLRATTTLVPARREIARALGESPDERATEALCRLLDDEARSVKTAAVNALEARGDLRGGAAVVQLLADSNDANLLMAATRTATQLGTPEAVPHLIDLLDHEHWGVRTRAAEGLANLGGAGAVDPLILRLRDRHRFVRREAAAALAAIGDSRALGPLREAAQGARRVDRRHLRASLAILEAQSAGR